MSEQLPIVYLARHGETAWTISRQHTGLTDLPLTERGERTARRLGERLKGLTFAKVWSSPLQRAARTCELAGFKSAAEVDKDLVEWDYGQYEGRRTAEILAERPGWELFRDGCPGGESPQEVSARADRVVKRVRDVSGNVLIFTSGHFMRVLATRWLGLEPSVNCKFFMLSTASLSAVGYEHDVSRPVIRLWNETRHVEVGQDE
ncbi:MAG TPA: histidine phosphatase family protein [Nitrospira sp.]|jgi:probable phosphoglycerate mutase|nr:histidine phosphatase family protein [Nitrospira sp.]